MGGVKRMAEEVARRMEIEDISDPRVLAEVDRQLSIDYRRLVVLESHPNIGGYWVGKVGNEREVLDYLRDTAKKGTLDYVFCIVELKEKAEHETNKWIDFQLGIGVDEPKLRKVEIGGTVGTPPLPGLEKRLAGIQAEAYGQHRSVWSLLQAMSDEEVALAFGDMLQSGRELVEAVEL